jgi:gamma-glutamylputrescine oxidase
MRGRSLPVEKHGRAGARAPGADLRCAHTQRALNGLIAEADWLRGELKDDSCSVLSRGELAQELGSAAFVGGVLNRAAGTIHPLNYVRGCSRPAAATRRRGA